MCFDGVRVAPSAITEDGGGLFRHNLGLADCSIANEGQSEYAMPAQGLSAVFRAGGGERATPAERRADFPAIERDEPLKRTPGEGIRR